MTEETVKAPRGDIKKYVGLTAAGVLLFLAMRSCQGKEQVQTVVVQPQMSGYVAPGSSKEEESTQEQILVANEEARNKYLAEAIKAYQLGLEQTISARANYFLAQAREVNRANGTPVERWLLNTANSLNVELQRKAGFQGTFTGNPEDQEAIRALVIDGLAIHRAYQEELGLAAKRANQWERMDPALPALAGTAAIHKGDQVFRSRANSIGLAEPIETPNPASNVGGPQ